ncbi:MAG: glutamate--tRNA ligase [Desulfovibrionaceae bacterium]
MKKVITRFAPSPTGHLHLGGARTAIFSYLWAKHTNGDFLLRIEDTDKERSKKEYIDSILESMTWLGLTWENPLYYQSERFDSYFSYIKQLLQEKKAYYCTCSQEEIEAMREKARSEGEKPKYNGNCRNKNHTHGVVRIKAPLEGEIVIEDLIKDTITINVEELDDMIICRSDQSPTYNFAVVIDDYEMSVTHVIRGDDHISNTPKQIMIYNALSLPIPYFAHVPMILGQDKQKLSKRHGATAVIEYEKEGILPHALCNYLVRLGWSYENQEIFSMQELISLFRVEAIHSSPAALDFEKLHWINAQYMRTMEKDALAKALIPFFTERILKAIPSTQYSTVCTNAIQNNNVESLLYSVGSAFVERAQTLKELIEQASYIFTSIEYTDSVHIEKLRTQFTFLCNFYPKMQDILEWNEESIHQTISSFIQEYSITSKDVAPLLRYAITASKGGPDIPKIMAILGKEESLSRIADYIAVVNNIE